MNSVTQDGGADGARKALQELRMGIDAISGSAASISGTAVGGAPPRNAGFTPNFCQSTPTTASLQEIRAQVEKLLQQDNQAAGRGGISLSVMPAPAAKLPTTGGPAATEVPTPVPASSAGLPAAANPSTAVCSIATVEPRVCGP
ncbi:hypothetical protein CYMTET_41924 [Cymbomonas tetramitiformis]|uniref:Uncharacterized protein n=1 Tax=Cymbomonas tetramitiformis TaxID=36881 RepID=A0AAE0F1R5_9CHLO|nr:hypothetical protein CYMTET_41924 [Cymbomonas tetramitiformis]